MTGHMEAYIRNMPASLLGVGNYEQKHLDILTDYLTEAGAKRLSFDGVHGHLLMIATVEE